MANKITEFTEDVEVIQKLGDYPNTDDGISADELKAQFDKAPSAIKGFLNEQVVPAVQDLQDGIAKVDKTLTRDGYFADAKATGEAIAAAKAEATQQMQQAAQDAQAAADAAIAEADTATIAAAKAQTAAEQAASAYDSANNAKDHVNEVSAAIDSLKDQIDSAVSQAADNAVIAQAAADAAIAEADTATIAAAKAQAAAETLETDTTLSVAGVAADAKETGKRIAEVQENLDNANGDIGRLDCSLGIVEQSIQALQNGQIVCSASGEVVTVHDASDHALKGLTLYGKTTQDGSPTPDAPIDLISVGNGGSVGVNVCGKNLLKSNATTQTINGVTFTVNDDGSITVDGTATAQALLRIAGSYNATDPVFTYNSGTQYVLSCAQADTGITFALYSRQSGEWLGLTETNTKCTFHPERDGYATDILLIVRAGVTVSNITVYPQIEIGATATDYEPYVSGGALTAQTPNGLPGIPVSSDGNYTDANSQQWICDEVDLARGVYVQRISQYDISGNENWVKSSLVVNGYSSFYCNSLVADIAENSAKLCTHFQGGYSYEWNNLSAREFIQNPSGSGKNNVGIRVLASRLASDDVSGFKTFLREKNVSFQYILETPIETPLSAEEIAAFKALHTNKPNTTVCTDSNAGIKLDYVADTKTYIDNKFAELAAAIVANV